MRPSKEACKRFRNSTPANESRPHGILLWLRCQRLVWGSGWVKGGSRIGWTTWSQYQNSLRMVIWKRQHLHNGGQQRTTPQVLQTSGQDGWSHVKALILLDIWKTGFCLINYPNQSMAKKKTCQPFSWSKVPISINGVDKSRSPEPSKTSWGQPTLEGYKVIVTTQNLIGVPPFFPVLNTSLLHFSFISCCYLYVRSFFWLSGKQFSKVEGPRISGLWKPSAVQRLHPAKPTECFTSSKKPCPFAVKSNREHM